MWPRCHICHYWHCGTLVLDGFIQQICLEWGKGGGTLSMILALLTVVYQASAHSRVSTHVPNELCLSAHGCLPGTLRYYLSSLVFIGLMVQLWGWAGLWHSEWRGLPACAWGGQPEMSVSIYEVSSLISPTSFPSFAKFIHVVHT